MARLMRKAAVATVAALIAATTAFASITSDETGSASTTFRARPSRNYESPIIPLDGTSNGAMELLCGNLPQSKCADVLLQGETAGHAAHAVGRNVASALASMVRVGPLLSTLKPGLPQELYDFMSYANKEIGAAVAAVSRDTDIVAKLTEMRRSGEWRQFAGVEAAATDEYPYWGFLPKELGAATADGAKTISGVATECFDSHNMTASWTNSSQKGITVTLTSQGQKSFLCTDTMMAGIFGLGVKFLSVDTAGTRTFEYPFDAASIKVSDPARHWYVTSQGVRLSRFNKGFLGLILDIASTVTLIAGFGENPVANATMKANFEFMTKYVEKSPRMQPASEPRSAGRTVANDLDESYISSGDSLIVVRYDGLDPVIGWGEGFTAGHSTIAIRSPTNGTLYVCESTAHDAYWARNGIQCHEFTTWIDLAVKAGYNVLLAPLSPEKAAAFNSTAALDFFYETEGLNYGYLNFLFGWIDQKTDNFPCIPPTYDYCLGLDVVETIALVWDKGAGNVPNNVFRQALNHRIGTDNLPVEQVMMIGAQRGLNFPDIYTKPEQDSWRYNTTRYGQPAVGRAMVCCVFVCHMWKHGGLFDSINTDVNCGEQTLWDIYSMEMFDPKKLGDGRPEVCKSADPNNQLCQLIGEHTFHAKPDFNTRSLYPLMGQNCSSLCPNYVRAPGC